MEKEQIVKALECCTSGKPCRECEYKDKSKDTFGCRKKCLIDALSLIHEQEKRIEELTLEYAGFEAGARHAAKFVRGATVRKMTSEIKARCLKGGLYPAFIARTIEKVAEEMLEDKA